MLYIIRWRGYWQKKKKKLNMEVNDNNMTQEDINRIIVFMNRLDFIYVILKLLFTIKSAIEMKLPSL